MTGVINLVNWKLVKEGTKGFGRLEHSEQTGLYRIVLCSGKAFNLGTIANHKAVRSFNRRAKKFLKKEHQIATKQRRIAARLASVLTPKSPEASPAAVVRPLPAPVPEPIGEKEMPMSADPPRPTRKKKNMLDTGEIVAVYNYVMLHREMLSSCGWNGPKLVRHVSEGVGFAVPATRLKDIFKSCDIKLASRRESLPPHVVKDVQVVAQSVTALLISLGMEIPAELDVITRDLPPIVLKDRLKPSTNGFTPPRFAQVR